MVSSRDRKFVSVETVPATGLARAEELSPEHRRLRFSFQFNDVKDRTDPETGPPMRSAAAGGGYLWSRRTPVNRLFRAFVPDPTFAF